MNQVCEPYKYTKLAEQDQIRLISLQPDLNLNATVRCSLVVGSLDFYETDLVEHYIALSYVWGDASDTRRVVVDEEKYVTVTASLDTALRYMRDAKRTFLVWADALCINQLDIEERNQQVMIMARIYGTARSTIISLGEGSSEAHRLVQEIIFKDSQSMDDAVSRSHRQLSLPHPTSQSTPAFGTTYDECESKYDCVLGAEWFNRVWVLQELVLSRDQWLYIGHSRIRWNTFSGAALRGELPSDARTRLSNMCDIRLEEWSIWGDSTNPLHLPGISPSFRRWHFAENLLELIGQRRGMGATDP